VIDWYFTLLDNVFLGIYIWEQLLKLFALRFYYFKSYWNSFDLVIVVFSLLAWLIQGLASVSKRVSNTLSIVRIFRTVRIIRFLYELKKVELLKSLQIIIATLFKSMSTIGYIALLAGVFLCIHFFILFFFKKTISLIFFDILLIDVCAVASVILYGQIDPGRFGSLGKATVRLFQVITLDRWSEMYTNNKEAAPSIWWLGFVFIIIQTFVLEK
jgi:voltage-gated sodium channel